MKNPAALFLTAVFFFCSNAVFAFEAPLPEGAIKDASQDVKLNGVPYNVESYHCPLAFAELASFYKEKLPPQGFNLVSEDANTHTMRFSNRFSDNIAVILTKDQKGQTIINLNYWKGPISKEPTGASVMEQKKDSLGEDIPGIPRYPGSIRITSSSLTGEKGAVYKCAANKEEIADFYAEYMVRRGWEKVSGSQQAKNEADNILGGQELLEKSFFNMYQKKDEYCGILITTADSSGARQSIISIVWLSKGTLLLSQGLTER